jgi:hypothetical protein
MLGVFMLVVAQDIRPASVPDPIGTRGAPRLVGAVFVLGGFALVLRRLINWRREATIVPADGAEDDASVEPGSAVRALSIWAASVVYVLSLPTVGYLLATPLFMGAVLRLFSIRRPSILIGVPIGFTLSIFLVFVELLDVYLPTGILDPILRNAGLV